MPARLPEAIAHFEAALRDNPAYAEAHNNLGTALAQTPGRSLEAIPILRQRFDSIPTPRMPTATWDRRYRISPADCRTPSPSFKRRCEFDPILTPPVK
jgi:tetratricopeptide (TPR) repeat protein